MKGRYTLFSPRGTRENFPLSLLFTLPGKLGSSFLSSTALCLAHIVQEEDERNLGTTSCPTFTVHSGFQMDERKIQKS